MRPILAPVGLVILFALTACRADAERAGARYVAAFERESRVVFFRCQDEACLHGHESECRPAHLHEAYTTFEGTKAFADTFIRPIDGGCEAVEFRDFSLDYWGGCRVHRKVCPTTAGFEDEAGDDRRCDGKVLFTAPTCEEPPWARLPRR